MTIGFDISMLMYDGSGVATYTENLILNLLRFHPQHSYKFFYSSLRKPSSLKIFKEKLKGRGKFYIYHFPPRVFNFLWTRQHILSINSLIGHTDIFFSSDFLRPPLSSNTRGVTTIHDLTWRKFPSYHTEDIISLHEEKLKKTIALGDLIITDSENTTNDLYHYYPEARKNKVRALHLGIDERYQKVTDQKRVDKVLSSYGIGEPKKYLLYVGAIEPRKNLETAINVYAELIKKKEYSDFKFLIIGRAGWKHEGVFNLVKKHNLENQVLFLGHVPVEELPIFYSAAGVNIYLSLYEGFGLPPLEAARCGTPSLIYSNSSLKETFPKAYPFAEKGRELEQLIRLIDHREKVDLSFSKKFTWEKYCHDFINFIQA